MLSRADLKEARDIAEGHEARREAMGKRHDESLLRLEIEGPGAVRFPPMGWYHPIWVSGKSITIQPSGSVEFEIRELRFGNKDSSRWLITEAGEYEARIVYEGVEAPTDGAGAGQVPVRLESEPVTFSVKT
ncbi:MAG: hypothetical protein R3242_09675 [Akkermansiaceae bacterium]|nr:hypothetical protein [Akkermansiaceae bacterium]